MGRMGRRQICNTLYIYNENIFDGFFFFLEKKNFLYESNMGRGDVHGDR